MKKRISINILILILTVNLFGQENKIDSLLYILKTITADTDKINALNELSWELLNTGDYLQSMQHANNAIAICDKLLSSGIPVKRYLLLNKKATAFNNLGIIEDEKGNYDLAMENYFKALKIKEELGDRRGIAYSYINLGIVLREKGDYSKALEFFIKPLKILEEINDNNAIAAVYNNLGLTYWNMHEIRNALKYYLISLKVWEDIGDKKGQSELYNNIGIIYTLKGDSALQSGMPDSSAFNYNLALEYYIKSLKIKEEFEDRYGIVSSYVNLGEIYRRLKKYENAREYFRKALHLSHQIGSKEFTKLTYSGLSALDSLLGNWKSAYEYHKLYSEVKDSMFNEESGKQIAEMSAKYETEKKELQIENLNKDNAIKETEIKKQNIQKLAFAGGFGLMLILAFVIFRGYKQKQKANEIITAQKTEVEKQKETVDEKNRALEVAYKHIEVKNTEILDSIRYAKRIQEAILPPQKLVKQYLEESFILHKPKDIVAGDFYWMYSLSPTPLSDIHRGGGAVLFACCDCTGHGVPGAFMSILGYNGLNRCVKEFGLTQPSAILDKLCKLVDEAFSKSETDIKDGMDIALVNLTLNPSPLKRDLSNAQTPSYKGEGFRVRLQYAGAGNSLYHIRKEVLTEYAPDKQPIGKFADRHPFTNHEIQLEKGDSVYVFTDGYADQFGGPKGKKFKYSQFENLLLSIHNKSLSEQKAILNETIEKWKGDLDQVDDICIIGVRV